MRLIVKSPFRHYEKGAQILDKKEIEDILSSESRMVTKTSDTIHVKNSADLKLKFESQLRTIVQNVNNLVVPDAYLQLVPPQPTIVGAPTNFAGIVGISSYGPVNIPVTVGTVQQQLQLFGPVLPVKYDLGTAVYNASLQGTQNFVCVRVTDGTDTSSFSHLLDVDSGIGAILTSLYTGELANTIMATISVGSSYTPSVPTYKLTINLTGSIPEEFDNIGGSGATFWENLVNAVNLGQSIARGPSQIVIASLPTGIEAVSITSPGSYNAVPSVSTTGPGSGAVFVPHLLIVSATLNAGGTGYAPGDKINLAGGTFTNQAGITVDTVNGSGAILTFTISTAGDYTAIPPNPVAQDTTTGSGTGATFNADWGILSVAITASGSGYTNASTLVFSGSGGAAGTLQIGSIAAPVQSTFSFSGGTNGNSGVTSATLVGSDVSPRTGMYALRQTPVFVAMLADADDPAQWPAQSSFSLSNACYVVGTIAAGYQDNIAGALTLLQTSGIDNYGFKLMHGDWVQFSDPFNNVIRYVSPQAFVAGVLTTNPPYTSSLNKPMQGIIATQRTSEGNPYSTADLAQLTTGRLDVITRPIPVNAFQFGCRIGRNTSSNALTQTDNYTLMANYIGSSIDSFIGIYVGQPQTSTAQNDAKASIQQFLMGLFQNNYIGDVNNPGDAASAFQVVIDSSNNPPDRVSAGYMQANVTVVMFSIIQFFVVSVNLIQGSSNISIPTPVAA